jgi:hypothetical protein
VVVIEIVVVAIEVVVTGDNSTQAGEQRHRENLGLKQ